MPTTIPPTILFIVDTSPSMATRDCRASPGGPLFSRMDCAKSAVELFLRRRKASVGSHAAAASAGCCAA